MSLPTTIHVITNSPGWAPIAQAAVGGLIALGGTISTMLISRRNQKADSVKKFKDDSDAATYRQMVPILQQIWNSWDDSSEGMKKTALFKAFTEFERSIPRFHFFNKESQSYVYNFLVLTRQVIVVKDMLRRYTGEGGTHDHTTELRDEIKTVTEKFKNLYTEWNDHVKESVGMHAII